MRNPPRIDTIAPAAMTLNRWRIHLVLAALVAFCLPSQAGFIEVNPPAPGGGTVTFTITEGGVRSDPIAIDIAPHAGLPAARQAAKLATIVAHLRPAYPGLTVAGWTASTRMAGKATFILAGWTGMNVVG